MKLIIDIPEERYKQIQEEQWLPNRLLIEKAIANGTSLNEVLGKIRAEIKRPLEIERYADTDSAKAQAIALNWCIEIIDKYRKEQE